jgi:hypothetical protein
LCRGPFQEAFDHGTRLDIVAFVAPSARGVDGLDGKHEIGRDGALGSVDPAGSGDWNTLAAGYRRIAQRKGLAVTPHQKIGRDPHAEHLLGAANVKLWTCLERRISEDGTRVERVQASGWCATRASDQLPAPPVDALWLRVALSRLEHLRTRPLAQFNPHSQGFPPRFSSMNCIRSAAIALREGTALHQALRIQSSAFYSYPAN